MKNCLAALAALLLSGCATYPYTTRVTPGILYSDALSNEKVTEAPLGSKIGQSCSTSYLGLVVTGDASVETAARNGRITRVGAVDNRFTNVLGLYANYCVIVSGD